MHQTFGLNIPQTLAEMCDPRTMAIVVYDMQIGVVKQIKNGPDITSKVVEVVSAARNGGFRVFFTRYMTLPKEMAGIAQLRMAMAWQRVASPELIQTIFQPSSAAFPLVPELAPRVSEAVFDRITMSAFEGNPLTIALRDCGIVSVALVGVALEVGIEPSVRHAADLGFIPIVITDACGAGHEDAAKRSIESLKFAGDAVFTDVATISALLSRK
ncbi:MAG TPA: cysteine hydrolase [Bryobacteraceae bacterium]|jgi:nicotinamidase-related amidase